MKANRYVVTEDLYYYSPSLDDNTMIPAGTFVEATGKHSAKAGDEFIIEGELIWITDAEEIMRKVPV